MPLIRMKLVISYPDSITPPCDVTTEDLSYGAGSEFAWSQRRTNGADVFDASTAAYAVRSDSG